ncbi:MAG: tetratricopeptide repeat protein, partial [Candidatus Eisenbacteria bacterium]
FRHPAPTRTSILAAGILLGWLGAVSACRAAGKEAAPGAIESPATGQRSLSVGEEENPMGGGNYDYFTASSVAGLAKYLALVSHRHVGEQVWSRFWAGYYKESLGDCEYALQRFPNHPRALHLVTRIAKATNQASLAIPYFERALGLYPQYAFTHAQYGHYLIDIGAIPAGVHQLREALRLEPNQFQAKAWLTEVLAAHPELARESSDASPGGSTPSPGAPAPQERR